MGNFFSVLWGKITAPFQKMWGIISSPYRKFHDFLTDEPEEHELMDVVSGVVSDKDIRQAMWEQVEDLRKHLLRIILGLSLTVVISFIFTQRVIAYLALPIGGLV